MRSTGIVRRIDKLGRTVIPSEMRSTLDLPVGTPMEIYAEGETIVLKKYQPACIFCDSMNDVQEYRGKKICKKCLAELKRR